MSCDPWPAIVTVCCLLTAPIRTAQLPPPAPNAAELWQTPADLATRNLLDGAWGPENAPDPRGTYTFVRPKIGGSSPGVVVNDARRRTWHVKQGREGAPEVVVSHLLSAVGYHQPPVYFLRSFTLADNAGVRTVPGGRFRLADASLTNRGAWDWEQNPFVGTTPYQGLLVILVLLNSADLKNSNNSVYDLVPPRGGVGRWYVVRDLGTSLGETGRFDPTPNDLSVFERHHFIMGVRDGYVDFAYRAVHGSLVRHRIRPDDVQWACRLLGGLSDRQWRDAFGGAGYDDVTAGRFIRRIKQKIDEGTRVGPGDRYAPERDFAGRFE